jgi:hypothetical protein
MSHHQEEMVPIELASPRWGESSYHCRRYNTSPDPNDRKGGRAEYKKSNTSTPDTGYADELGRRLQRLPSLASDSDDYKLMSRSRSKSPSAAIATQRSKSPSATATATQHKCLSKSPLARHDETSQNNDHHHDNDDEKKS